MEENARRVSEVQFTGAGRQQLRHHTNPTIQKEGTVRPDCRSRQEPKRCSGAARFIHAANRMSAACLARLQAVQLTKNSYHQFMRFSCNIAARETLHKWCLYYFHESPLLGLSILPQYIAHFLLH